MNEELNNETPQQDRSAAIISWLASGVIRIASVIFWCFIYIGFIWFLDDRTGLEKLIGFTTLILGVVGVFTPMNAIGKKWWLGILGAFYVGGLFLWAIV
ncbi:MAG: hypothetical protein V3U75_01035 [Methylococcaceae bacterium]